MGTSKNMLKNIANLFQRIILSLIKWKRGQNPENKSFVILPYLSYASRERVHIRGRVVEGLAPLDFTKVSHPFRHFVKVIKLFLALESPHVPIIIIIDTKDGPIRYRARTNAQGFFFLDAKWNGYMEESKEIPYHVSLDENDSDYDSVIYTSHLFKIQPNTKKVIISDIDDTILKSKATSFTAMMMRTLFRPPQKRKAFPEASKAYQVLRKGSAKNNDIEDNLFFYISSSSWNIYPLLKAFIELNQFPAGALILQDIKTEKANQTIAHGHKLDRIREVMELYHDIPITLIGDAGQQDQDIYLEMARRYPKRIDKILIRNRWWTKTIQNQTDYLSQAKELKITFEYFENLEDIIH